MPEVPASIERLDAATSYLRARMQVLYERLASVMAEERPEPENPDKIRAVVGDPSAEVARRIDDQTIAVSAQSEVVDRILDRLEV